MGVILLSVPLFVAPRDAGAQGANPAPLRILATAYKDLDGDQDPFPDTGETGRATVTLTNTGGTNLTGITFNLVSTDADVSCITERSVSLATIAPGQVVTIGSLAAGPAGFTFRASDSMNSTSISNPAAIDLCLLVTANEIQGLSDPLCFRLFADLNLPPGASQVFTLGPDGVANTSDDGTVVENFDTNRDGLPDFSLDDLFRDAIAPGIYTSYCSDDPSVACNQDADCPVPACDTGTGQCTAPAPLAGRPCAGAADCGGPPVCYKASYIRGSATGTGAGTVAGVTCGGYDLPSAGTGCALDPDYPMDWHFHCPAGATHCPNADTPPCVGSGSNVCTYATPSDGARALSAPNSLHMGAHFNPVQSAAGDTTHFRSLQGFMTPPMNLAVIPRPGDLDFSFYHIADLMRDAGEGNGGVGGGRQSGQCMDCGDVQIQLDQDPDPRIDAWGFWSKLVPFENVYDNKVVVWSAFSSNYCAFTPTDTGTAPPNPNGVHETLCFPQGAWANCGDPRGTTTGNTHRCAGPGAIDASGVGVWVRTSFSLEGYLGQRIRLRWIAETWNFDPTQSSYYEVGNGWSDNLAEDGWWLDDVRVAGTIDSQIVPLLDQASPPSTSCSVQPDLEEVALTDPPAMAQAGSGIALTDTAANLGDGDAPDSTTGYYLSLDTAKDAGDVALTTRDAGALAAAGGTSQGSVTPTIPPATARGHYYVLACADATGLVPESSESNNCRASRTTVQVLVGFSDLIESFVSNPPASAVAGSSISVSDTVTNQGAEDSGPSVSRFYLSLDTVKNAGDVALGTRGVGIVATGASSSGTSLMTVPAGTSGGLYYLIVCADDDGQVTETDETNNCRASATQMLVTRPDLVESAVPNPPTRVVAGSVFTATDTVTNQGNGSSGSSVTRYYLALGTTRAAGDLPVGTRAVGALAAGAASSGSGNATVPMSAVGGTFYLLACADDDGEVAESNETNNCRASSKQTLVTGADLSETMVANPPASILGGDVISISDTVKNLGTGDAGASVTRFYLSLDTVKSAGDIVLGSRAVGPLQANKISTASTGAVVPSSAAGNSYYLIVCADDDGQVQESNETNNCRASNKVMRVN